MPPQTGRALRGRQVGAERSAGTVVPPIRLRLSEPRFIGGVRKADRAIGANVFASYDTVRGELVEL